MGAAWSGGRKGRQARLRLGGRGLAAAPSAKEPEEVHPVSGEPCAAHSLAAAQRTALLAHSMRRTRGPAEQHLLLLQTAGRREPFLGGGGGKRGGYGAALTRQQAYARHTVGERALLRSKLVGGAVLVVGGGGGCRPGGAALLPLPRLNPGMKAPAHEGHSAGVFGRGPAAADKSEPVGGVSGRARLCRCGCGAALSASQAGASMADAGTVQAAGAAEPMAGHTGSC